MKTGIYKLTNLTNGKIYIGQSKNITQRWEAHKNRARDPLYNTYLSNAMRKDGIDNFKLEVLEECLISELNEKEKYWIEKYDAMSREVGYNQTEGGIENPPAARIVKEEDLLLLIQDLKECKLSMKQIGEKYGISEDSVSLINLGHRRKLDGIEYPIRQGVRIRKPRPDKDELINKLAEVGPTAAAEYFNVSRTALRNWCKGYEIPQTVKEFNDWYEKNYKVSD